MHGAPSSLENAPVDQLAGVTALRPQDVRVRIAPGVPFCFALRAQDCTRAQDMPRPTSNGATDSCYVLCLTLVKSLVRAAHRRDLMRPSKLVGVNIRETNMRYFVAMMVVLCSASSAFAESVATNPRMNDRPVDRCLVPAKQCGQPAADRYCQIKNLGHAVRFDVQRSAERTYILGTGEVCDPKRFGHCDRFSRITCSSGGNL